MNCTMYRYSICLGLADYEKNIACKKNIRAIHTEKKRVH